MKFTFSKYQGTGNDFILINGFKHSYLNLNKERITMLCDRKFGIGADGLIILKKFKNFDFYLDYYNADGTQSFCGNGSRCGAHFALKEKIILSQKTNFMAVDGFHDAEIKKNVVLLKMKNVEKPILRNGDFIVNTGSPHYLTPSTNLSTENTLEIGQKIRFSKEFAIEGINVNLFKILSKNQAEISTYERGVESETLSCGTGATACALVLHQLNNEINNAIIHSKGGDLGVSFQYNSINQKYEDVYLQGNVNLVFDGECKL